MTRSETGVLAAVAFVAWAATTSLLLAAAGWHAAAPAVAVIGFTVVIAIAAKRWRAAASDLTGALLVLGAVVVGGVMFAPAFAYGSSDRDPGVYAYTTYAIARTGSVYVPDPLGDLPRGTALTPLLDGQRVPGVHPRGRTALPGFFLAEPALGATAYRIAGDTGRRLMNPLVGIVALAAFGLAVRRLADPVAAVLTVALLGGNMVQVWQAKVPGPELLAEAGIAGALLAAAVAIGTKARAPAAIAGVLTTFVWVARPDGLLAVLLGLAVGYRSRAYLTGLAAAAPVALWQTYGLAADYAHRNAIPPWSFLVLIAVAVGLAAPRLHRIAPRARPIAMYAAAAFVAVLLIRQALASDPPALVPGAVVRGYDAYTLSRIAGLITWPVVALAVLGVRYVTRDRRTALLLVPAALGTPYLVAARVSPDLMFWGRRFVPTLLPGLVVLAAVATAQLLRTRLKPVAALAAAIAVVVPYTQSLPLRTHDEYGGGLAAVAQAAAASRGEQAVYIWVRQDHPCCDTAAYLFAGAVWLRHGKASFTVRPEDAEAQARAAAALPYGWPVLVVAGGTAPPFAGLEPAGHVTTSLTVWERGGLDRPDGAHERRVEFTVWRYAATTP